MIEHPTSSPVSEQIYCRGCGYALQGTASRKCGECGHGFDLDQPSTFAYENTHTNANERWFDWVSGLYIACMALSPALLLLILMDWTVWLRYLSLLSLVLIVILMGMQTILAGRVLGYGYALRHVAVELLLLPLATGCMLAFGIVMVSVVTMALILITVHVLDDIQHRWRPIHANDIEARILKRQESRRGIEAQQHLGRTR